MTATVKNFDLRSENREETINRLKSDISDRIEEALDDIITKAMSTKEGQSINIGVSLKCKKGDWQSEVSAKASINYGKTTRDAQEIGGQLALQGVVYE